MSRAGAIPLHGDDIRSGLDAILARLKAEGIPATINVVGGASLILRGVAHRKSTYDIDAVFVPKDIIERFAAEIAAERGWQGDWLNSAASIFVPNFSNERIWEEHSDDGNTRVLLVSEEALLAMKLNAGRMGKDDGDVTYLMDRLGVDSAAAAEKIFERYYPGDALSDKSLRMLSRIGVDASYVHPAPKFPENLTAIPAPITIQGKYCGHLMPKANRACTLPVNHDGQHR